MTTEDEEDAFLANLRRSGVHLSTGRYEMALKRASASLPRILASWLPVSLSAYVGLFHYDHLSDKRKRYDG